MRVDRKSTKNLPLSTDHNNKTYEYLKYSARHAIEVVSYPTTSQAYNPPQIASLVAKNAIQTPRPSSRRLMLSSKFSTA